MGMETHSNSCQDAAATRFPFYMSCKYRGRWAAALHLQAEHVGAWVCAANKHPHALLVIRLRAMWVSAVELGFQCVTLLKETIWSRTRSRSAPPAHTSTTMNMLSGLTCAGKSATNICRMYNAASAL